MNSILSKVDRTYFIETFGCQQNENDSEILAGHLEQLGYLPCGSPEEADVVLLNTCSVREHADDRFFGHLGRLKTIKQEKPDMFIGVGGCILMQPQNQQKILESFPFVDLIFGTADLGRFPDLFFGAADARKMYLAVGPAEGIERQLPVVRKKAHRALVSIMYGCNNFCTYCIVPHTRGRERSRPKADVMQEIRDAANAGYKEILLLGQNVNAYGKDRNYEDGDFADLLADAARVPGLFVVRFMTSHPKDVSARLIETIGREMTVEPHFHLPLQSGSDAILKKMNRHYTSAQYIAIAEKLRQARPGLTLTTDIIVGFPGETEADFAKTMSLIETVKFDSAFTFIYSPREGTPAAAWDNHIDKPTLNRRYQALTDLQYALSRQSNERLIGQTVKVLITGPSESDASVLSGRTADNRLVLIPLPETSLQADNAETRYTNTVVSAVIRSAGSFSVEGSLVDP